MSERGGAPRVAPEAVGQESSSPTEEGRKDRAGRGLPAFAATAAGTFVMVAVLFLIFLLVILYFVL